jgi:hypothetical protein
MPFLSSKIMYACPSAAHLGHPVTSPVLSSASFLAYVSLSVAQTTINCKACGRKRSEPNLGHFPEGLKKRGEFSARIASVLAEIRIRLVPDTNNFRKHHLNVYLGGWELLSRCAPKYMCVTVVYPLRYLKNTRLLNTWFVFWRFRSAEYKQYCLLAYEAMWELVASTLSVDE